MITSCFLLVLPGEDCGMLISVTNNNMRILGGR